MGSTFSGRSFFNSAIDFCAYTDDIKFVGDIKMTKQIITTTNASAAIGPYSQAVLTNGTLYASGQVGLIPSTGEFAGETTLDQATQVFKNIDGLLAAADMTRADIVKVSVYLADMADFAPVNELYAEYFSDVDAFPARSAVAVATLPKNARIEIEVIANK